jgi:hypothetical protein
VVLPKGLRSLIGLSIHTIPTVTTVMRGGLLSVFGLFPPSRFLPGSAGSMKLMHPLMDVLVEGYSMIPGPDVSNLGLA